MTLYELTAEQKRLLEIAEDPETDQDIVEETMTDLKTDFSKKLNDYGIVMRELEVEIDALKSEESRLAERRKVVENNRDRMKKAVLRAMIETDQKKVSTPLFKFSVAKSPKKLIVDKDWRDIPMEFLIEQDPKINKDAIKKYLEDGNDADGIAHFEQGENLRIK